MLEWSLPRVGRARRFSIEGADVDGGTQVGPPMAAADAAPAPLNK